MNDEKNELQVLNPYGDAPVATMPQKSSGLLDVEAGRAVADIQAMIMEAKRWPRNQKEAADKIITECQRPGLAAEAIYSYARGGTDIQGPSIRLAEVLARNWTNLDTGIQELSRSIGQSLMRAYCTDLETNYRAHFDFFVVHERTTKKGTYQLTDGRDIYETVANQASRRLRAMILKVIPSDIVDAAVRQCEATLKAKADMSTEGLKRVLDAFAVLAITREQIEKRIQRNFETITPAQLVGLKKVENSIKDGMSNPSDWFEMPVEEKVDASASLKDKIKAAKAKIEKPTAEAGTTAGLPLDDMAPGKCPNTDKIETKAVCDPCPTREGCPVWDK